MITADSVIGVVSPSRFSICIFSKFSFTKSPNMPVVLLVDSSIPTGNDCVMLWRLTDLSESYVCDRLEEYILVSSFDVSRTSISLTDKVSYDFVS